MTINHSVLGAINVKFYESSRHIKARWVGQELRLTAPKGLPVAEIHRFLDKVSDRLVAIRPAPTFSIGMAIDAPHVDFSITSGDTGARDARIDVCTAAPLRDKRANYTICISDSIVLEGVEKADIQDFIGRNIIVAARHATTTYILPRAKELAEKVGCRPRRWVVREGRSRHGSCSSRGVITLSPRLIFLPDELCDFVIYHELAHLTEMNHSAAFHALCNNYCGGREAELNACLKAFRFPIP